MGIAERVYEVVKSLPETAASEVLDYAERKRFIAAERNQAGRAEGRTWLRKHAGKFKMAKINRDDPHDGPDLR